MAPPGEAKKQVKRSCLRKQLRKTKMCQHFERGECHFGLECAFAHSPDEIQSAPDLRKTRLCEAFADGNCRDANCSFAHGEAELRSTDLFFKKTLCIWNEKGKCRAGAQCRFAHGQAELRTPTTTDGLPSVGSQGHPERCAPPCKYHSRKKGCKDGPSCSRCHRCPWRPESSGQDDGGRGHGKRSRSSSDNSTSSSLRKQRRARDDRLDQHGNSRPSWLRDDRGCAAWDYWKPVPAALPHFVAAYGPPPLVLSWGCPAARGCAPTLPVAGYPAGAAWDPRVV
mmetsp:Transcript_87878/g.204531  ORF Transcript_87878/g.204531 Transcript_87878/m.204531 type:complete len:282 (-) Transcript_87878:122-967(-)|eukprot:CAMPEP_0171062956 /NCGR_PEP_ID=MMETSP0766_2-20121228/5351_1 /TAXON_ID=439317 /ORGANISM="Gambierdiscus australes, Strain CAWD 149" /LENGTH=281 /DNA_ID=CAMNT_0011518793 /DNA_START=58 /DNA_END=903 /DNA_ORIENTATION=+